MKKYKIFKSRGFAIFMTLVMCLNMMNLTVFASSAEPSAKTVQAEQQIAGGKTPVYYAWTGNGFAEDGTDPWVHNIGKAENAKVSVSKTIEPTGEENLFDITLKVVTKEQIQTTMTAPDAAVTLVIDTSGSMAYNTDGTKTKNVPEKETRLYAAKQAAIEFIEGFADSGKNDKGEPVAKRMVSIVQFASNSSVIQNWVDVTDATNLAKVTKAIEGLSANGGTNTEAGLQNAVGLYGKEDVKDIANRFSVLLTDGMPTYNDSYEEGNAGNKTSAADIAGATKAARDLLGIANLKSYAINFASANQDWMRTTTTTSPLNNVRFDFSDYYNHATWKGYTYTALFGHKIAQDRRGWYCVEETHYKTFDAVKDAQSSSDLLSTFKQVLQNIKDSVNAWKVTDPMGENIEYVYGVGTGHTDGAFDCVNGVLTWNLRGDNSTENTLSDGTKEFTYELHYQVRLNNLADDFSADTFYKTNGRTYLTYTLVGEKQVGNSTETVYYDNDGNEITENTVMELDFKVPAVKGYLGEISFTKENPQGDALSDAEFTLRSERTNNAGNAVYNKTFISGENGLVEIKPIPSGERYVLSESNAPAGYDKVGNQDITVAYGDVTGLTLVENGKLVDPHHVDREPVTITKHWVGGSDTEIPASITVTVERFDKTGENKISGENAWSQEYTISKNSDDVRNWTYTCKDEQGQDLIKTDANGNEYTYKVTGEVAVSGWTTEIDSDETGKVITNTFNNDCLSIVVNKEWILPAGMTAPSVTVKVSGNGAEYEHEFTSNGSFTFENLPKYDANGTAIQYEVQEILGSNWQQDTKEDVPANGSTPRTVTFTNTVADEKTSVSGQKIWADGAYTVNHDTDTIIVQLLQDGVVTDTKEVSKDTGWAYEFSNLPKYNFTKVSDKITDVSVYEYTVQEVDFNGYTSTVANNNITNTPDETVDVTVEKVWKDHENSHGAVTVQLYADGIEVAEAQFTDRHTFAGLPKFKAGGALIDYTVQEVEVPGGYAAYYAYNDNAWVITNVAQDKVSVAVNKIWQQPSDAEKATATFELYMDGTPTGKTVEITGDGNAFFTGLEMYYKHNNNTPDDESDDYWAEHTYSVVERDVPGYVKAEPTSTAAAGDNDTATYTFNFVNTITGTTSVKVNKSWEDAANTAGRADVSFTVKRTTDGVNYEEFAGNTITIENGNTTGELLGLAKYDGNGRLYTYVVEETELAGYTPEYSVNQATDGSFEYDVTNVLNQAKADKTVSKVWADGNTPNAERPAEVVLNLLRDGKPFEQVIFKNNGGEITATATLAGVVSVSEDGNTWSYTFKDLDVYDVSRSYAYAYTVEEAGVPEGYKSVVDNDTLTVTNTAYGETNEGINITKYWVVPAGYDLSAAEITLRLNGNDAPYVFTVTENGAITADGEKLEVTVSGNTWSFTTPKLPTHNSKGEAITYTLTEDEVAGFTSAAVENDRFAVRNTIAQEFVTAEAEKLWEDTQALPESITVALYRNGDRVAGTEQVVANVDGSFNIQPYTNLDKYNLTNGSEYVYDVRELNADGTMVAAGETLAFGDDVYTVAYATENGKTTITNTYTENKTDAVYRYAVIAHYTHYNADGTVNRVSSYTSDIFSQPNGGVVEIDRNNYVVNPEDGLTYAYDADAMNNLSAELKLNDTVYLNVYYVLRDVDTPRPPVITDDNSGGGDDNGGDDNSGDNGGETTIPDEPAPLAVLPDEEVPMAVLPEVFDYPEEEYEEILDEDIPLSDVPRTGDNLLLWLFAAAASGAAALTASRKRK